MFLFVNVGFPSTAFGIYQPYLVELPGMGHAQASMVVSARTLVSLIATFLVARYYKRLDCRLGVAIGTVLTGLGFVIFAFAKTLPLLVVGGIVAGLGYGLGGAVGMTLLVGRWYRDDVGKAAGFAAMGSGAAGAVIPLFAVRIIESTGLTASFLFEAAIAFVAAITVFLLLRNKPEDMGLEPHVSQSGAVAKQRRSANKELPKTLSILLIIGMIAVGAGAQGGVGYIGILMTSNGISQVFAATLISIAGVALCVGKIGTGAVMDAVGTKRGSLIFFLIFAVGLGLCCLAPLQSAPICIIAVTLYGIGASLGSTGISVWSIEFSQPETRPRIARNFQSAYMVGGFISNLLPGILAEATGTYVTSFALMAVYVLVATFIVMFVYRHLHS